MASNIKNQLFSGVFYTALAKYSGIVISLVIAGILARLLSPDDFGIVAVATVIIAFFSLLTRKVCKADFKRQKEADLHQQSNPASRS